MSPQKICPQCKMPAPLDAGFCGQCGRPYRTRFGPDGQPLSASAALPPPRALSVARGMTWGVGAAVALLTCGLLLRSFWKPQIALPPGENHGKTVAARDPKGLPIVIPPRPAGSPPLSDVPEKTEPDPLQLEAKRVIERATKRMDMPPPAPSGSDDRIQLRGGGSIRREEWQAAQEKLRNSPLLNPGTGP